MPSRVQQLLRRPLYSVGGPYSAPLQQQQQQRRFFSAPPRVHNDDNENPKLTHVNPSGAAHMVSISSKQSTSRTAVAACAVHFSKPTVLPLISANSLKKGDVLSVARIAGIMAAKRTPDLIPLCHPIPISHVSVDLDLQPGEDGGKDRVDIRATVSCDGKTGVEMEALTAASTAALTVYDMCKAVDKEMRVEGLRVVLKEGGKSGRWEME